ncbi:MULTISPECIES: RNA polymerase sporulation sigma factor SigH [Bacillaceae]|uniref:RNA polymerase sigma factor SigS n=2 Tax=Bacillus infantis TaxID=324767 RepID=U5LBY3_9BACI|nr:MULTISPECIES: RNA polymerase sporulation sigma factor SigH [Bacillus]OXT16339.1 RNA polymerase sporulation sigma factor SigH [Bacillus sp. OG2]AGX04928.1 RNA polymerase sigma70 factor [Bacillus infantis NRRL B-14911]EAR67979.1 RNA polymerase sigma-70 factor [Bacillus sp. NRRL B-14911]MCA1035328.1 RNA polymerase sporulation sigma factor SigH [Bacillus infantis]MCK6207438.1 RNA polymerase sporulation sigma factor SigH [Bacillus infantis]
MSASIAVKLIEDYSNYEDETLVVLFQNGDGMASEYLMKKYRHFVRAKASKFFLIGGDKDDLFQEGMIGLYKAIRDFKEDKLASFKVFAELCITRQIITAVKTATRQKQMPLNSYISLDKPIYEDESKHTLMDILPGTMVTDPAILIVNQENTADIEEKIAEKLSDLERKVLDLYVAGHSYIEISEELDTHVKSIDNALQRVKRKLDRYLERRELVI